MIEVAKEDVVIVSGGDSGMNEFFVQRDIKGFADCAAACSWSTRPDTAYALQLKKILAHTASRRATTASAGRPPAHSASRR